MERVETLLQKLQKQISENLPVDSLLITVEMMQHELMHLKTAQPKGADRAVSISMPLKIVEQWQDAEKDKLGIIEERTVEILQVDEAAIVAELEEIKRNATVISHISSHSKPQLLFDMGEDDIPTLIHQNQTVPAKEINETVGKKNRSLNDSLKEDTTELSAKLSDAPVKDLKKAIGVNERFLFINELFRGDEVMYERSIKTINSFTIWPEAEYWVKRELKTKLGWKDSNETVQHFDQLVKRRFS